MMTLADVEARMIELDRAGLHRSDEMSDLRDLRSRLIYGSPGCAALMDAIDAAVSGPHDNDEGE